MCFRNGILPVVAAVGIVLGSAASARAQLTTYAISLGDTVIGDNRIVTFDPLNIAAGVSLVYDPATAAPNASPSGGTYNGLAADVVNERLFFRGTVSGGGGNGNLYTYDLNTGQQRQVTGSALPGATSNAAFFGGAYWYIEQGTDTLVRVTLNFTNPNTPTYTFASFTDIDGSGGSTNLGFGDIVISSTGQLYGSSSQRFFTLSVASGTPTDYSTISTSSALSMQMVFDINETTLYGAFNNTVNNSAQIFQITPATGAQSSLGTFSDRRFADLTGIVRTGLLAAPEPGSLSLTLLGMVPVAVGVVRRRQRRERR